jgi:hypothetical protein
VIGGSATVFEVGPDAVKVVWNAPPGIGNLTTYTHPLSSRWEIEYADVKRVYGDLPNANLLDIYEIDRIHRSYRRLIHQPVD